jgi:pimeloyl-ACP methyl ester carboxylesterase
LKTNLIDIGIETAGSPRGKPVIFVHGWGGCRHVWKGTLDRCPESYHFISLDLPGTGGSAPLASCTIPALARWVLDTADRLGLSQFALAGHSMGGNVAASAAQQGSDRITQLVLVDAALYPDRVGRAKLCTAPVSGHAALALARAGSAALGLMGAVLPDNHRGGFWRPYFRRNQYVVMENSHQQMHAQLRALVAHPFDMRRLPPDLPVLIMHGEKDQVIPFALAREMLASRPKNTRLISYPKAMHCPMDMHPDRFISDLLAYLDMG